MIVFKCEGCGDTSEIINVLCGCGLIQKPVLMEKTEPVAEVPCSVGLSATVDGMDNVEYFICRLIDQCEGEIITEEFLHRRYADFVKWHGQKGR